MKIKKTISPRVYNRWKMMFGSAIGLYGMAYFNEEYVVGLTK